MAQTLHSYDNTVCGTAGASTIYQSIKTVAGGERCAVITARKAGMKNWIFVCMSVGVCVYLRFPLKDDHSAPFVPCGQELSGVIELNSGDDISWG